jgi:F420-dependent oxidoreductase-like protein
MSSLNAGLVIPRGSAAQLVERARQAEQRGVPAIWTTVGGPTADTVGGLTAVAAVTDRVALGTAVAPVYGRHPITLAAEALAINDLAPGRMRLGVGNSHRPIIEDMYGIPMVKPLVYLREYVTILRGLLWQGKIEFEGEFFRVKSALPETITPPQVPIPISALRRGAFELAGEVADGAITWVTPIDYIVETGIPAMQEGAERAGRARPPVIAHVPVSVSTDRQAARDAFRKQFPVYSKLPFYAAMFAAAGFPVTAEQEMSDALVDELAVSGDAAEIRSRLEDIRARGIDELLISHVTVADETEELAELSKILAG